MERCTRRRHVVIDRSIRLVNMLPAGEDAVHIDVLHDEPPALAADAVVTDPPWYPEHLRSFLWTGARLLKPGGTLYACLPPIGTRPSVEAQRSKLLEWAQRQGLELVQYRPGVVRYVSSPFELASHRAAGLGGIPLDWRSGDLGVLRVVEVPTTARPRAPLDAQHWRSFTIDEIPVWVRDRVDDPCPLGERLLWTVIQGDVLSTVSRRDPLRAHIDVWTSLNRVYSTSHPAAVQAICRALAGQHDPVAAVAAGLERALSADEGQAVAQAAARLETMVVEERAIHGLEGA